MTPLPPTTHFADTKPHFQTLDALRGVAALLVIWYHVFEGFATSPMDQKFNHGFLAVDFFFILSGFVMGYAYDDRWKTKGSPQPGKGMGLGAFFRRRLIRLHPMVFLGAVVGALTFLIQGSVQWDGTSIAPIWVVLALFFTAFMIPSLPGGPAEVRGNGEIFPLNGPSWSLFFEYIGNLCYAFFLRRFSTRMLRLWVWMTGAGLAAFALLNGSGFYNLGVGWTFAGHNLLGGALRLLFAFPLGLLLSRNFKPRPVKGGFWIASATLLLLFALPYIQIPGLAWANALYEVLCIAAVFPVLVCLGASEGQSTPGQASHRWTQWLGGISYPLYMIHYPFMYLFYAYLWKHELGWSQAWPLGLGMFFGNILLAWAAWKWYDEPVRRYLRKRFDK